MLDDDTVRHQQRLLAQYRSNLMHLIEQAARYNGEANVPLALANDIREARAQIRSLKQALQQADIPVGDHPNDEPSPSANLLGSATQPQVAKSGESQRRWLWFVAIASIVALAAVLMRMVIIPIIGASRSTITTTAPAITPSTSGAVANLPTVAATPRPSASPATAEGAAPVPQNPAIAPQQGITIEQTLVSASDTSYRFEATIKNTLASEVLIKKISIQGKTPPPLVLSGCQGGPQTYVLSDTLSIKSTGEQAIVFQGYIANNDRQEFQYPVRIIMGEYQCRGSMTLEFDTSFILSASKYSSFYIVFPKQFKIAGPNADPHRPIALTDYVGLFVEIETDGGIITSSHITFS